MRSVLSTVMIPFRSGLRSYLGARSYRVSERQAETLSHCLDQVDASEYARTQGLTRKMRVGAFLREIPYQTYDDLEPYLEKVRRGELGALFREGTKIEMFTLSSGTTGPRKSVPITSQGLAALQQTTRMWGTACYADHPGLLARSSLVLASDWDQYRTEAGFPCGDVSGFLCSIQPWYVRAGYQAFLPMMKIKDVEAKYYCYLLAALKDPGIGMIMTATPSTLTALASWLRVWQGDLIKDLYDGKIRFPNTGDEVSLKISKCKRRARELERLLDKYEGLEPWMCWQDIEVIGCWLGGTVGYQVDQVRSLFRPDAVRDLGLVASEAYMTVPLHDDEDHGILNIDHSFFEFLSMSSGETYLAHELRDGDSYEVVVTTMNGLIRYRMGDIVTCVERIGELPILRFDRKTSDVSDITGEKLSASHVLRAVDRVRAKLNIDFPEWSIEPIQDPAGYRMVLTRGSVPQASKAEIANALDSELQDENFIYREHRQAAKLVALHCSEVGPEFFAERRRNAKGAFEQYKAKIFL